MSATKLRAEKVYILFTDFNILARLAFGVALQLSRVPAQDARLVKPVERFVALEPVFAPIRPHVVWGGEIFLQRRQSAVLATAQLDQAQLHDHVGDRGYVGREAYLDRGFHLVVGDVARGGFSGLAERRHLLPRGLYHGFFVNATEAGALLRPDAEDLPSCRTHGALAIQGGDFELQCQAVDVQPASYVVGGGYDEVTARQHRAPFVKVVDASAVALYLRKRVLLEDAVANRVRLEPSQVAHATDVADDVVQFNPIEVNQDELPNAGFGQLQSDVRSAATQTNDRHLTVLQQTRLQNALTARVEISLAGLTQHSGFLRFASGSLAQECNGGTALHDENGDLQLVGFSFEGFEKLLGAFLRLLFLLWKFVHQLIDDAFLGLSFGTDCYAKMDRVIPVQWLEGEGFGSAFFQDFNEVGLQ